MSEFEQGLKAIKEAQDSAAAAAQLVSQEEMARKEAEGDQVTQIKEGKKRKLESAGGSFFVPILEKVKGVFCPTDGEIKTEYKPFDDALLLSLVWNKYKSGSEGHYNRIAFRIGLATPRGFIIEVLGGNEEQEPSFEDGARLSVVDLDDLGQVETKVLEFMGNPRKYHYSWSERLRYDTSRD